VWSTIHYQNKMSILTQDTDENKRLLENKNELILKLASLEKNISQMDTTIANLGKVMDIDPQSFL